ncbi:hypothetical protein ACFU6K_34220 [Kitasatospora sp. NPDC057512]|uniref:hypothetical protein n=1 Tax=Kitasatospora sp. NPDC057512 TaxID=3346154 RepID=UPI00368040C4
MCPSDARSQSWKGGEQVEYRGEGIGDSKAANVSGRSTKREDLYIGLGAGQSGFPAGTWKHGDTYKRDVFS